MIEQCQVVSNQLEPLVFVEAAKAADVGAFAELQRLVQNMAAAVDQPTELLRLNWRLYQCIAEMGVNAVLTGINTTLLKFLEQEIGQIAPIANYSNPQQVVATSRELVEAIASGDTQRAAAAAKRNQLREGRGLSDRKSPPINFIAYYAALPSGTSNQRQ